MACAPPPSLVPHACHWYGPGVLCVCLRLALALQRSLQLALQLQQLRLQPGSALLRPAPLHFDGSLALVYLRVGR